ncbi:MAG: RnfH family protein [Alysiella sp.]|uniref:RnfH family protein n=1 Tax=Alysiella sp. TaxID=1872483 RepID=UPI0026DC065B|nr:RnfH family protein [Alysiella sp.]MDO4434546.1 RnfH family protein [Alysiella sp.]
MNNSIEIEIVCGDAQKQKLYRLNVSLQTTARQAVSGSMAAQDFPAIDIATAPLGIFGKVIQDDIQLQNGDRIEIYRPLFADPKEARRKRVENKKKQSS